MSESRENTHQEPVISIRVVDLERIDELERHVAFERAHGMARFDAAELQAWLSTVDAVVLLAAEHPDGTMVGCAVASVLASLGLDTAHVNGFCRAGEHETLRALTDEIARWGRARGVQQLIAHVSGPTVQQEQEWRDAGFTWVGSRSRIERVVVAEDAALDITLPPGVEIEPLMRRPELAAAALGVWNDAHADIPTPLPFTPVDHAAWRAELEVGLSDPFPPSLLVATTADDDVAGLLFLNVSMISDGVGRHRFTGVASQWRGHGIATAMKVAIIRWAANNGVTVLRGSNDADNAAMIAVNRRLGYEEQHRIVLYRRDA